jgi:hypothetical protein
MKSKHQPKMIDLNKPHTCEWCLKSFAKESTLLNHVCEPKRRANNQYLPPVKIAYAAYNLFYEFNGPPGSKNKIRTYKEFSASNLYTLFVKFGEWVIENQIQEVEKYIVFCLKSKIKGPRWADLNTYNEFLSETLRSETPEDGLARTLKHIQRWSEDQGADWQDFFRKVNSNVAINWLIQGRISPWMLYNCESAIDLFGRCSDEQLMIIQKVAPMKQWTIRILRNKKQADLIKSVLTEAGM